MSGVLVLVQVKGPGDRGIKLGLRAQRGGAVGERVKGSAFRG